jgi:hypothetical protein
MTRSTLHRPAAPTLVPALRPRRRQLLSGYRAKSSPAGHRLARLVRVTVMDVRVVWMAMNEPRVSVHVDVRLPFRVVRSVSVRMVFVMEVPVLMDQRLVGMLVFMAFGQVEPDADAHEYCGDR